MKNTKSSPVAAGLSVLWLLVTAQTSLCQGGEPRHFLPRQLPPAVAQLRAVDSLPATNQLQLAINLPVRNPAELAALLKQIYDPASANFRQYLTQEQFAKNFGASESDYQAAIHFAEANGLRVTGTHANHLVLDVAGAVPDIEKTFQVKLKVYPHPRENRKFYAPNTAPSVDASLAVPILSISGLNNYSLPQPASLHLTPTNHPAGATPDAGSGPNGTYLGRDFRLAYAPGSKLNGTGQSVALLEFDGYYSNDITAYETAATLPAVPLTNVAVNGGVSTPGTANDEVALDIEMVIAMATNLTKVLVYEAPNPTPWPTILAQIADDNLAAQISCSWGLRGGSPDPASEQIFQQMAAQGQSFFAASGDDDAYVGLVPFPDDSPTITVVGGTTLTTITRSGARSSETVWNRGLDTLSGKYVGTGGGISPNYSLPTWQQGINSVLTNGGSLAARNIPDVALTAESIYVKYGNGLSETVGGTSCAAPLWAGFMALVNQQAVTNGKPVLGFINPAIYELANESIYAACFNDITTGSNAFPSSPNAYFAVTGYDLCTGIGTPKGTSLINALVSPDSLVVVSNGGFKVVGTPAGTFNIVSQTYYLTNTGATPLTWSLINTSIWLTAANGGGTLAVGGSDTVLVSLNNFGSNLVAGTYSANLWFSNITTSVGHSRFFTLKTSDALVLQPPLKFFFSGPPGGPFTPATHTLTMTNPSPNAFDWSLNNTSAWFTVSPLGGTLPPSAQTNLTFMPTPAATNLTDGFYTVIFQITNRASQFVQRVAGVLAVGIVQNGGFEFGDFTDWTLVGHTFDSNSIYNGVVGVNSLADGSGPNFIHSGNFGAFLGDTNLATLSQSLSTKPGQKYLLSFWVDNPIAGAGQQFIVNWNTNSTGTNQIYFLNNPPVLPWTNVSFFVQAADTNATLQFAAQNPPNGFGLDDVSLIALTPPVITSQPTNLTVLSDASATFSATANGFAPLSYQWLQNGTNLGNDGNISGATSNVLRFTAAVLTNSGNYTLVVTNNYGSTTSSVATLTVLIPPGISNVVANLDGSITLNLLGTPGYTYIVLATTNLFSPASWLPIATNTLGPNGIWHFSDPQATNFPLQFYRLMQAP